MSPVTDPALCGVLVHINAATDDGPLSGEAARQDVPMWERATWAGHPFLQHSGDVVALQDVVWRTQPDLIIETGIFRGGSLSFYASLLELLGGDRLVVGIDKFVRPEVREALNAHRQRDRMHMIYADSVAASTLAEVHRLASSRQKIMVVLDSDHSAAHVSKELELYADLVSPGQYLIVADTAMADSQRAAGDPDADDTGDNPRSALRSFLRAGAPFTTDLQTPTRYSALGYPDGYLRRNE